MLNRRQILKGAVASLGVSLSPHLVSATEGAGSKKSRKLKRVIFFLQNQGFNPETFVSDRRVTNCSLDSVKMEQPVKALEPYKDRMHFVMDLHGFHTSPSHSAGFGALGGYRGGASVPPSAPTIDYIMSQNLPSTIMPHLCIGMDSLEDMKARPTIANLSASGAGKPIFMHSDPNSLYQTLYGSIAGGKIKQQYEARSKAFKKVEKLARSKSVNLPESEAQRYATYVNGFEDMNSLRSKLASASGMLKKYVPKYDERYTNPKFETDWHDVLLEIGISALQSNLTNTLTIGSGRGHIFGAWKGLGIATTGHNLGHIEQPRNEIWTKIRNYNCQMLVKIMKALEAVPEDGGTMWDHTLIVYTSNNGRRQHTAGENWPFLLLDGTGIFKTNQLSRIKGRPINDFYTTLLQAMGVKVDYFNLDKNLAAKYGSRPGPIEEILA